MKKILLLLFVLVSFIYSKDLNILVYKNNQLYMEYHFDDVKNWKWMTSNTGSKFIRVFITPKYIIDLPLNDYDVKIDK